MPENLYDDTVHPGEQVAGRPTQVVVLGARGRISRQLTSQLAALPDVDPVLVVRSNPDELASAGRRVEQCDVTDTDRLAQVLQGADVVVAAVNGDLLAMARSIVAAMHEAGVRRVLWVTGLGIHHEVSGPVGVMLDRLVAAQPEYVQAAEAFMDSDLDYTLLRCPHLGDGASTTHHIARLDEKPNSWHATRAAVAAAIAEIIADPTQYVRESIAVTN